jgi:hypothetical protein
MLRSSEWPLIAFFVSVAALCISRDRTLLQASSLALAVPVLLVAIARAAARSCGGRWTIVRDWLPVPLVLVAYFSVDWVAWPHGDYELENRFVRWDRALMDDWGLRRAIESLGPVLPALLEAVLLAVYLILPLGITYLYARRQRDRIDTFLFPFLMGTLAAFAVLPHYPTEAPRLVFAGIDVPPIDTAIRRVNLWILDRWSIESSVLPNPGVALALSAALAMRIAAPERRGMWGALLMFTLLAWAGSVYGRYHYAVDGAAAVAISTAAVAFSLVLKRWL